LDIFNITEEGSRKTAKCKGCKIIVSAKSERLTANRQKCCDRSFGVREQWKFEFMKP
jgi:hypothetical protein